MNKRISKQMKNISFDNFNKILKFHTMRRQKGGESNLTKVS